MTHSPTRKPSLGSVVATLPFPAPLDFADLKRRVSIGDVLAARGLMSGLRRRGHRLTGACPVHGGDNPTAFDVDLRKNLWNCFTGCGGGGDVIELVRRLDGVSHRDAARWLSQLAPSAPEPVMTPRPRAFRPFEHALYLDPHSSWLASKGILPTTAQAHEAGAWHGGGMLSGCVAVRLHSPSGTPWGYAGRRCDGIGSKWVFPPSFPKSETLYGHHRMSPVCDEVTVVECPWGVMRLAQLGVPAVALLGTSLSATQAGLLATRKRVRLMMDGDAAGRRAAREIAARLQMVTDVVVVELPSGCDPDDLQDAELRRLMA